MKAFDKKMAEFDERMKPFDAKMKLLKKIYEMKTNGYREMNENQ
jgi:hypothetical protein